MTKMDLPTTKGMRSPTSVISLTAIVSKYFSFSVAGRIVQMYGIESNVRYGVKLRGRRSVYYAQEWRFRVTD